MEEGGTTHFRIILALTEKVKKITINKLLRLFTIVPLTRRLGILKKKKKLQVDFYMSKVGRDLLENIIKLYEPGKINM